MGLRTKWAAGWQAAFLLVLVSAGAASAAGCHQSQPSGVALVAGTGRTYFHGDADLCPGHQPYCLKRAYVIAKDRVVTSVSQDGYTCVFVPSKTTTTIGWIETNRLLREPVMSSPPSSAWEGVWKSEGVMTISVGDGKYGLQASGVDDWNTYLYGDDGKNDLPARNHHAEFSGRVVAVNNHARLKDAACGVDLILLDEFLIVEDGTSCGDGNTSFRGIYRRKL